LIVTTKTNLTEATNFFDNEIGNIYEYIPKDEEHIDERNIIPTRLAKQRRIQSSKTIARSTMLNTQIPQTIIVTDTNYGKRQNNKRQMQYNSETSIKQQKREQGKTDNTEITTNTKTSHLQEIEQKFEGRITTLEKQIATLTSQLQNNESNREKERQTNKQEIAELIISTIQKEIPTNMIPNFNMMANQITDLNSKFDQLMRNLNPTTPTKQTTGEMNHTTNKNEDSNKPTQPMEYKTNANEPLQNETTNNHQMATPLSKQTSTRYASPVNQWNVVGTKRKTRKDSPISRERTIKETVVKERLLANEKSRQEKKTASKQTNDPMETTDPDPLL
jgi:hypothetical protein